ncbi:MAG: type II restriction endonuclease [Candidatus Thorarchaeota archaeon]
MDDFIKEVDEAARKVTWDLTSIKKLDDTEIDLPAKSTLVTAILEELVVTELERVLNNHSLSYERGGDREYPDLTISGKALGEEVIALDVKTCRKTSKNKISRFTLGSYVGYFRKPDSIEKGCKRRYSDFTKHLIVGLIYEWYPEKKGVDMVIIQHYIVAEKWKLASKVAGSGNTQHIGSVTDLDRILKKNGDFTKIEEFKEYWRAYEPKKKKTQKKK